MDSFRGLAGDVVCSFVHPSTIFKSIPVLIFFIVTIGAIAFALDDVFPFDILLSLMVLSFAVSRFAIPAVSGEFDDGWFSSYNSNASSLAFSTRYVVITLIWSVPSAAILWLVATWGGENFAFDLSPMSLAQSGLMGIVTVLLGLVFIFAPTLGFIICTATDEIADMFSLELWKYLLIEQKADLVVFYTSLIGGVLIFWLIYALPLIIIVMVGATLSSTVGGVLGGFIMSLPLIMAPVLLGRLCGALVKGAAQEEEPDTTSPPEPEATQSGSHSGSQSEQPTAKPSPAEQQPGLAQSGQPSALRSDTSQETSAPMAADSRAAVSQPRQEEEEAVVRYTPSDENTVAKLLEKVDNVTSLHMANALLLARNRLNGRPDDPFIAAECTLLLAKSDNLTEAVESAANAIPLALHNEFHELAIRLYMACGSERRQLKLDKGQWNGLSSALIKEHHYQAAVVCLQSSGLASAQKLKSIADLAKSNGKSKQALNILQLLLKKYPKAAIVEQVREEIRLLQE
ncbi:MAG: hypothetical protein QGI68_18775 [Pseudomonadales bacterium]|jgi:hypothetical protein|nr:hypothetical protein [Pseudomonadales bacterium]MDP7357264.1 hypothetical protein [Pseudomonadales bacterium]MDP7597590.1 hypothetical protein [Pseudomonadales bacterium]HJN51230.1 hypothetical protein [Pseudomonadales bacterium]|tara:strand:- start:1107 stop:2648 length:1542 start_codon:yes stop_codon:yes gene_type:complete